MIRVQKVGENKVYYSQQWRCEKGYYMELQAQEAEQQHTKTEETHN